MAEGDIGAVIDTLEFDATQGAYCSIIHISGDVYAIAYDGPDSHGWLCTVTIDAAGQVGAAVIDTLEFDATGGAYPRIIHISGDVYAIAYTEVFSGDGWLCTVTIESNGQIGAAVIDTLEFDIAQCITPRIIHVSGDVYAIAYSGVLTDGWLCTVTIESNGQIGAAVIDTLEFDIAECNAPSIIHVSGNVYAIVYEGVDGDGWLRTVTIESNGLIGAAVIGTLEFDSEQGTEPVIIHISGEVYAIAYSGALLDGWLRTVTIKSTGQALNIDTLEFDVADCRNPSIVHVSGDVYAIAYSGVLTDGWLCTVTIESNGQIGAAVIDTLEFDIDEGRWPDIIHASRNIYAIAYSSVGNDGFVATIDIDTILSPLVQTDPATEIT